MLRSMGLPVRCHTRLLTTGEADNAFTESKFRAECLNVHWFISLDDARRKGEKGEAWRGDYNEERPQLDRRQSPNRAGRSINGVPARLDRKTLEGQIFQQ
jgi:Integrase core domain